MKFYKQRLRREDEKCQQWHQHVIWHTVGTHTIQWLQCWNIGARMSSFRLTPKTAWASELGVFFGVYAGFVSFFQAAAVDRRLLRDMGQRVRTNQVPVREEGGWMEKGRYITPTFIWLHSSCFIPCFILKVLPPFVYPCLLISCPTLIGLTCVLLPCALKSCASFVFVS